MKKILIIDGDGIVRDALKTIFSKNNYEVFTAVDGINGVIIFKNHNPDIVLLDRELPMGIETLKKIREISPKTPVVILTIFDRDEDAKEYFNLGATAFFSKSRGIDLLIDEINKIHTDKQIPATTPDLSSKPKILVVDDEECVCNVLSRFLKSENYLVVTARDGVESLKLVEIEKPDIILLDIKMPNKNGVEVLKEVNKYHPEIGVMMITGNEDEDIGRECLKLGAFDYISKPINLDQLDISLKARLIGGGSDLHI